MRREKTTTYSDIAQYTNLSKMTISRYFNQPDTLADETKEKIEQALRELNYSENKFAKALASGKSGIIGIITPTFFYNFYTSLIDTFIRNYPKSSYKFLVFTSDSSPELERRYIAELLSYRIEGLVVLSHTLPSKELSQYPFPVVGIERESEYISSVDTDNVWGTRQAVKQLLKDQCEALVHINLPTDRSLPAYARIRVFEEMAYKAGVPYKCFFVADQPDNQTVGLQQNFLEICGSILKLFPGQRVGIFISNDTMAALFLNCALLSGIKVPEQFEIIGFDNSPISEQSIFPISTVGQNVNRMVSQTIQLIDQQLNEKKKNPDAGFPPKHLVIRPRLILRGTTLNQKKQNN